MDCENCTREFDDTADGLTELIFHKIIIHGSKVNQIVQDVY